ncbi:hypothetical protein AB0I84_13120 [Streptomyces spectabilis]|uniref:hypothetical protein n=1 Tax=Streptomyces spectabilis TaxID=68270 RepID=UPI0033F8229F
MPDRPYTDADLRAEAARQHALLAEDSDYMGVGEQMDEALWTGLAEEQFDEAQRKIHDLITGAADVSEWAVNLGADGLEPLPEQFTAHIAANGPWFRLHFAVRPDIPDDMRRALVEGVGSEIAKHF